MSSPCRFASSTITRSTPPARSMRGGRGAISTRSKWPPICGRRVMSGSTPLASLMPRQWNRAQTHLKVRPEAESAFGGDRQKLRHKCESLCLGRWNDPEQPAKRGRSGCETGAGPGGLLNGEETDSSSHHGLLHPLAICGECTAGTTSTLRDQLALSRICTAGAYAQLPRLE